MAKAARINRSTMSKWKQLLGFAKRRDRVSKFDPSSDDHSDVEIRPAKWSIGILNDKETEEVPGMTDLVTRP